MHSTVYALSRSNHRFIMEFEVFEKMQDWADYVDDITERSNLPEEAEQLAKLVGAKYLGENKMVIHDPCLLARQYNVELKQQVRALSEEVNTEDNGVNFYFRLKDVSNDNADIWIAEQGYDIVPRGQYLAELRYRGEKPTELYVVQVFDYHC